MTARTVMVQGTGSHVGKSVVVAALCRLLHQEGFRVAPFKSQNMSNNSYVTPEGGEMGRAQAVQAEAAGVLPTVDMNPILLKPSSDTGAQVVLHGRPFKTLSAQEYQFHTLSLFPEVCESFERLRKAFDIVVIEGAGSPAEINLQAYDIANMRVAEMAGAPVILVGDIDRGGVFASFVGTLELIPPSERPRVKAFLINKFRGDPSLLSPGIDFLHERTGLPTLGVLPYLGNLDLLEEDGLSEERIRRNRIADNPGKILIDIVWLPRISNFTDFTPLDLESDVVLTYLREVPDRLPDVLILPGTKSTVADLKFLKESGFADWIHRCAASGVQLLGICGGYQMLGRKISDPFGAESGEREISGLGLLPTETVFYREKQTRLVRARHRESRTEVSGYEIHMGQTTVCEPVEPVFEIIESERAATNRPDGSSVRAGQIWGTYLHGLFENDRFRNYFLDALRERKGLRPSNTQSFQLHKEETYNRLAEWLRQHIDTGLFYRILEGEKKGVSVKV